MKLYTQDIEANYVNSLIEGSWKSGSTLYNMVSKAPKKERFILKDLMDFLLNTNNSTDICALYGIRRTGKTVMMHQAIRKLVEEYNIDKNEISFITIAKGIDYTDKNLINDIRAKINKVKYFFIDEISYMNIETENNMLSLLADEFAKQGAKIVITGTFSYAIKLLKNDVLFDRVETIDTTYFSFKEAHDIFGMSIETFITHGGIIIDKEKNKITPEEYMKTAVRDNIVNSLMRSNRLYDMGYFYKPLQESIDKDNDKDIRRILNKLVMIVIDQYMRYVVYNNVISDGTYRFSDIGNLSDLIRQRSTREHNSNEELDVINIDKNKYYNILEKNLGSIGKSDISQECFDEIMSIFRQIGIIEDIYFQGKQNSLLITNYLRYGLCEKIINSINNDIIAETNSRYDATLVKEHLKGTMLESIIQLDIKKTHKYVMDKYRNGDGREVDIIIEDKDNQEIDIYEVKYSTKDESYHLKNMFIPDFILEIENRFNSKVRSYNLIYNGKTLKKKITYEEVYKYQIDLCKKNKRSAKYWEDLLLEAQINKRDSLEFNFINAEEFLLSL